MKFKTAFNNILKLRNSTQPKLAEETNVSQAAISMMMSRGNPSINVANKYLDVLGYEIAFVPKGTSLPSGAFIIDNKEQD